MSEPITHLFIRLGGGTPDVHTHPIKPDLEVSQSTQKGLGIPPAPVPSEIPGRVGAPTKDRSASRESGWSTSTWWGILIALTAFICAYFVWQFSRTVPNLDIQQSAFDISK